MARAEVTTRDPFAPLRYPDYQRFTGARFLSSLAAQMLDVAIGWDLYARTGSALALGLIGLVQVIPILVLSLPAGQIIDRVDRRGIVMRAQGVATLGALALTALALMQGPLVLIYACLVVFGAARAFSFPALTALLPAMVPEEVFTTAVALNSSTFQLAAVAGPGLAGVLIAVTGHATIVYAIVTASLAIVVVLLAFIHPRPVSRPAQARSLAALIDGWRFLWRTHLVLSAITLDLFAVLLGGATSLLPIYARDILHAGPVGLGWLRAAPSVGSFVMALIQAHRRPYQRAGRALLLAVAGFGAATIVFGLSRSLLLSLLMLFLLGMLDNVSVVLRQTLVLLRTPDAMRGRVAAVNSIFVSSSNELGGFESGMVAAAFGPVVSVVSGGVGTLLVVLAATGIWPELRQLRSVR